MGSKGSPSTADLVETAQVPRPGGRNVAHLTETSGDPRDEHLGEREHRQHRNGAEKAHPTAGDQDGTKLVTSTGTTNIIDADAGREILAVTDGGIGYDEHTRAGELCSPAQVDVFDSAGDPGVEPTDRGEQTGAHQHACGMHREHVGHRVVLLLITFAGIDEVVGGAELIDAQAHVLEDVGLFPRDQLRSGDTGIGSKRLGDQVSHGVGRQRHVVVTHQQERRGDVGFEHRVGGGREPDRVGRIDQGRRRRDRSNPIRQLGGAGAVDHDEVEAWIVLGDDRIEGLVEPVAGIMGDHHGGHRRRRRARLALPLLGRRVEVGLGHDLRRLPPGPRPEGTPNGCCWSRTNLESAAMTAAFLAHRA